MDLAGDGNTVMLTGKALGKAFITVTAVDGGLISICAINVKEVSTPVVLITDILVSPPTLTLNRGKELQIDVHIIPANATHQILEWVSDNEDIATVNNNGKITGLVSNPTISATCTVIVTERNSALTLDVTTMELFAEETGQLHATITSLPESADLQWDIDNAEIASINSSGAECSLTGLTPGEATITVSTADNSQHAICLLHVKARTIPVTGFAVDPTTLNLMEGDIQQITARITPSNATNQNIFWNIDNINIVSIS